MIDTQKTVKNLKEYKDLLEMEKSQYKNTLEHRIRESHGNGLDPMMKKRETQIEDIENCILSISNLYRNSNGQM
jgi:ribose 5-phosphate isomerase